MITLCIPTIRRFDLLQTTIKTAKAGSVVPDKIVIMDNSCGDCPKFPGVDVIVPKENKGVAGSWNYFFNNFEDDIIISNDDVEFKTDTIELLIKASKENPDKGFIYPYTKADHDNTFSVFLLRKSLWKLVGEFDEFFFPAYFEDNDYHYRMKLAGFPELYLAPGSEYIHAGSATLQSYNASELTHHYYRFSRNQDYFVKKWGGMPGKETYTIPFNEE